MMKIEPLLQALWELWAVGAFAALAVMLLGPIVRRWLGAGAAYSLWALLPVASLAVLLPAPKLSLAAGSTTTAATLVLLPPTPASLVERGASSVFSSSSALLCLWLCGTLLTAMWLVVQQRRCLRRFGQLMPHGGGHSPLVLASAGVSAGLPAMVGLARPRIVLPDDFAQRYDVFERRLILAHERVHLRRGDGWANAAAALLLCLHWFNPLLHLAMRRFRHDQELACDARVLAEFPQARKRYAAALLKGALVGPVVPMACQWRSHHPLKERIMMLKNTAGSSVTAKRLQPLLLLVVLGGGYAAWAQQPAQQSSAQQQSSASVATDSSAAGDREATVNRELAAPPHYPQHALQQAQSGKVVALVDVDAQGRASAVHIESSTPAGVFDQAVRDAVGKWQFEPARKQGKPVSGRLRVPVTFDSAMTAVAAPAGQGSLNWYQVDWGSAMPEGVCTQVAADAGGHTLCGIAKSTRQ